MRILILLLSVAFYLLPAVAGAKSDRKERMEERLVFVERFAGESLISLDVKGAFEFEPLGTESLLLYGDRNQAYLLKVDDPCINLLSAFILYVRNNHVVVNRQFCRILEVRVVDVKAMKIAQKSEREADKTAGY
jgi:hypothetical protein